MRRVLLVVSIAMVIGSMTITAVSDDRCNDYPDVVMPVSVRG